MEDRKNWAMEKKREETWQRSQSHPYSQKKFCRLTCHEAIQLLIKTFHASFGVNLRFYEIHPSKGNIQKLIFEGANMKDFGRIDSSLEGAELFCIP